MRDAPTAPDPYKTAAAQTQTNIGSSSAQQRLNMVDQTNAGGSLKFSESGTNPDGTPKFSANTTLSAPMQGIFDKSTSTANTLLGSGAGALGGGGLDLSYDGTAGALDKLSHARLDPQWAHNSDMQESKLAAQGLTPGMPGYDRAMAVFNQSKNDAYNSSNRDSYGQAIAAKTAEYGAPLTALGSLLGTAKGTNPTFASTPQTNVAGTNLAGLVEDNYKQESANANAANGQTAGIFGSLLGAGANLATGGMSGQMGGLFGSSGGGLQAGQAFNNPRPSSYYGPLN